MRCTRQLRLLVVALLSGAAAVPCVLAGGSGFNTVVVANQSSSNSCALANYFCERRGVPAENLLRISWTGTNTLWSDADFQAFLLNPLLGMLSDRGLGGQVDYVVLSMDIPYETGIPGNANSTTAALFYGLKSGTGTSNSYAGSEAVFSQAKPGTAPGYSFLSTMLTGNSLEQAKQTIDQGVLSDGTFPSAPVLLAKSSDPLRNIRYWSFDNAVFNVNLLGRSSILVTNSDSPWSGAPILGYESGLADFTVPSGAFLPGAMADSMTSFGGKIFDPKGQTTALAFLEGGACGSYGTVEEPGTDATKFPNPQAYFYQARGFSLAECYYQSLKVPYLGLVLGEPLAAPFARKGSGKLSVATTNEVIRGSVELSVSFVAADASRPIQQVDLFADGKLFTTLTNLAPGTGNILTVELNGYPVTYTVPPAADLNGIVTGLTAALNASPVRNAAEITASAFGDRVELHSLNADPGNNPFYVLHQGSAGTLAYEVVYLPYPVPPQLIMLGLVTNGLVTLQVNTPDPMAYILESSTDMREWVPVFTNLLGGTSTFTEPVSQPMRLYRVLGLPPEPAPSLAPPVYSVLTGPGETDMVKIDWAGRPYQVLASSNLVDWIPMATNLLPGQYQLRTFTSPGTNTALNTLVNAARAGFLDSSARGVQQFSMPRSTLSSGSWIQFSIVKTNGETVLIGVTNQVSGTSSTNIAAQLCSLISDNPALAGNDGLAVEDFYINSARTASFNLRARSTGLAASGIQVLPARSGVTIYPSSPCTLTQNLNDLQPRNHLYITAGASRLSLAYPLNTTLLTDGYHELAAVAYEGSNMRTQTRVTCPLVVQNSALSAALISIDLTNGVPVSATYHLRVEANSGDISAVTLFSTGGALATASSAPVTFTVDGTSLGVGLHPFYAVVEGTNGTRYRTATQWFRLVSGS